MSYTPWKFVRRAAGAFDVVVQVDNMGPAKVTLSRIELTKNASGTITNITPTEVGSIFLKKSGKGRITVPANALPTDGFFVGHCHVLNAPSMAAYWKWSLGIEQQNKPCGVVPTESPTTGQRIGALGVLDPSEGGYEFGGHPASESTISFDFV